MMPSRFSRGGWASAPESCAWPHPEAGIDVDKLADVELVERILTAPLVNGAS
jgi:hypothetical protein